MLNNLHMSAHMLGKALDGDDLFNTTYELMVKILRRLAAAACLCVCGIIMFMCHYVLSSLEIRFLSL